MDPGYLEEVGTHTPNPQGGRQLIRDCVQGM
jgi:hypothetical protein